MVNGLKRMKWSGGSQNIKYSKDGDYMKLFTRLLTRNLQKVPLLWIDFNMKKFKENGAKGSCMCHIHPVIKNDEHIIETMQGLCDYIRENYNMKDVI